MPWQQRIGVNVVAWGGVGLGLCVQRIGPTCGASMPIVPSLLPHEQPAAPTGCLCASAVAKCLAAMRPCCCVCSRSIKQLRHGCDWQTAYGSVCVPSLAGLTAQSCVPAAAAGIIGHHVGLEVPYSCTPWQAVRAALRLAAKPLCWLLAVLRLAAIAALGAEWSVGQDQAQTQAQAAVTHRGVGIWAGWGVALLFCLCCRAYVGRRVCCCVLCVMLLVPLAYAAFCPVLHPLRAKQGTHTTDRLFVAASVQAWGSRSGVCSLCRRVPSSFAFCCCCTLPTGCVTQRADLTGCVLQEQSGVDPDKELFGSRGRYEPCVLNTDGWRYRNHGVGEVEGHWRCCHGSGLVPAGRCWLHQALCWACRQAGSYGSRVSARSRLSMEHCL